jgi:hypothetical protein
MAWFRNHYHCGECGASWEDEWSCTCDDDCPECGSRHYSPFDSDDLSVLIEAEGPETYAVYYSPPEAEDKPRYILLATVNETLAKMMAVIAYDLTEADHEMSTETYDARGWFEEIADCVLRIGKSEFALRDLYGFEPELAKKYPGNRNIRAKIRQQLQRLRDQKKIDFLGDGTYRLR